MGMVRTPWPAAFTVVAVVHLVLNTAEATPWDSITKCLLAPMLVLWVLRARGPRILALALALCFVGDLFLTFSHAWFIPGMAAFGLAHVAFIMFFLSRGAGSALRRWWPAAVGYAGVGVAVLVWLWPGLDPSLRIPMTVYAALLAITATLSLSINIFAGFGALLFLASDAIIAMGEAGYSQPHPENLWIMALYLLAIFYLTSPFMGSEHIKRLRPDAAW